MIKNRFSKLVGLVVASMSTCFASSCSNGLLDAVRTGIFDFTSGTVTDTLGSVISVPDLLAGAGAGE